MQPSDDSDKLCDEWAFTPGASFVARIVRLSGDEECKAGIPEVEGLGDWTWELDPDAWSRGLGHTLDGQYSITNGTCSASLWLTLVTEAGANCDANDGTSRACRLKILLTPRDHAEVDCPELCGTWLNVRVKRL